MNRTLKEAYDDKYPDYFGYARRDIVDDLAGNELVILEVGCGTGATLAVAKSTGKASRTVGIEIDANAAKQAQNNVDELIEGDIESIDLPFPPCSFDVLILSEILEHLVNPWHTLSRLRPILKIGGTIYASSPNVAHTTVLRMLLRNRWDYKERGRLDFTHLRWFTPATYKEMIEAAGFGISWIRPIEPLTTKQTIVNSLTFKRFSHLFMSAIFVKAVRLR